MNHGVLLICWHMLGVTPHHMPDHVDTLAWRTRPHKIRSQIRELTCEAWHVYIRTGFGANVVPSGAWPRDAAVDTRKQAGRQSTALTGASSRSCHVTKRFRILATLKQGNKSMYSNTSGYVHMGLRLDWGKSITGQSTLSPNSYPNPRSDPLSGWQGRGLKHNLCPAQSGP